MNYRVLDLSFLESMSGGDSAFIEEILQMFVHDVTEDIAVLTAAVAAADFPVIRKVAHKLNSTVIPVGLSRLQETLKRIEVNAAREEHLELIREEFEMLRAVLVAAVGEAGNKINKS